MFYLSESTGGGSQVLDSLSDSNLELLVAVVVRFGSAFPSFVKVSPVLEVVVHRVEAPRLILPIDSVSPCHLYAERGPNIELC